MKQKTFEHESGIDDLDLDVGDEVLLVERSVEGEKKSKFFAIKYDGKGFPTNGNPRYYKYHGWCGTTNGVSYDVYGVRKIIKASKVYFKEWSDSYYCKYTVGHDIHPNWD